MSTTNQITIRSLFYPVSGAQMQYTSTTDILTRNGGTNENEILYINNSDKAETLLTDFEITHSFNISSNSKPLYVKSGTAINVKSEIVGNVNTIGKLICNQSIYLQNKSIDSDGNDVNPGLINIDGGKLKMQTDIKGYKGVIKPFNNRKISTSDKNDYGIIQIENGTLDLENSEYHFYDIQLLLNKVTLHDIKTSGKKFVFENSFIDFKSKSPTTITGIYSESNTRKFEFTNCDIVGEINSKLFGSNTDIELNVTLNNSKVNLTQSNENLTEYSINFTDLISNQSEIINTFNKTYLFRVYFNGATFTDTQFKFLNGLFCVGKGTTMDEGIKMDGEGSFRCVNSIIYLGGVDASDSKGKLTIDLPYPIYLKSCNIKLNPDSSLKINECINVLPMCFLDRNSNISIDLYDGVDNYTAVDFSTDTNKHYLSELGIYIDKGALSGINTQITGINSKITTLEKDSQLYGDQLGIIRSKIGIDQYGEQIDSDNTTILNRLDTIQNYIGITNEGGNNESTNGLMDTVKNYGDQLGIIRGKMGIDENGSYVGSTNNNDTENMLSRLNAIQKTIGINNLGVQNDSINPKSVLIRLDAIQKTVGINESGSQQTGAGYETTILNRLDNYKGRINNTETKIGINENGSQQTGAGYETTILNRLDDYKIRIGNAEKNIGIDALGTPITSDNTTILKRLGTIQDYIGITNDGENDTTTDRLMDTVEEYGKQIGHLKTNVGINDNGEPINSTDPNKPNILQRLKTNETQISTNETQIGHLKTNVGINDNGEPINSTDPNKPNILQRLNTNKTQIGYLKTKVGINDDGVQQKGDSYKTSILNRLDRTESNIGINDKGDKVGSTKDNNTENMLSRLEHIQEEIGIDNLGNQDDSINNNSVLIRLDNYGDRISINETQIGYLKTNVGINDLGVQQKGDSYKTSILNRLDRTESNIGIDNKGDKLTGEDYESTILDRLDTTEYDIDMLYDYENALSEVLDVEGVKKLLEKKNYEFDDVLKYIVDIIENRHSDLRSINMKMLILSILANKQKFLNN